MRKEIWFGLSILVAIVIALFVLMPTPSEMTNGHLGLLMLALVVVELGLITPPVGMNVFVINSLAKDVPMWDTFKGVFPFFIGELVRLALLIGFPALTLWLPHMVSG